jgi:broad specificity polyphosphatase/5'/3'-nucleotidase SurE
MKKMVLVLVMAMICLAPALIDAQAAVTVIAAKVNKAGVSGTATTHVFLTDTAATKAFPAKTYFICASARAKEMLAVALTAISMNKTVNVTLSGVAPGSTVQIMYLNE